MAKKRILLAALLVSFGIVTYSAPASPEGGVDDRARMVVNLTNAARSRARVPMLRASARLMHAAQLHANQMARTGRLTHVLKGADHPRPEDRLQAVRYQWEAWAENVALGQRDADHVVRSWMKSRGHRANVLNKAVTEIGVGYAEDAKGRPYWVQVFAKPVS